MNSISNYVQSAQSVSKKTCNWIAKNESNIQQSITVGSIVIAQLYFLYYLNQPAIDLGRYSLSHSSNHTFTFEAKLTGKDCLLIEATSF